MTRSKWANRVWGIGILFITVVSATVWFWSGDQHISMLTALVGVFITALITLYVKLNEDRKVFLNWLVENSYNGQPHFCLGCWQPLSDLGIEQCPHCSDKAYHFVTDLPGKPLTATNQYVATRVQPAVELPSKLVRDRISYFLQEKQPPMSNLWGCLAEILGYIAGFGLMIVVSMMYMGEWDLWWILIPEVLLIIVFLWVGYKSGRNTPYLIKREVKKYCPDGVVPWCIYCDYDLRGNANHSCPECGKSVYVYDFKWRPWKHKRSRPGH